MSDAVFYLAMPLRYYPDLTTGEFLNVGVALVCPDAGWWDLRVITQMRRVSRLFPTAQADSLSIMLTRVMDRLITYKKREGPTKELAFERDQPFAVVKQIVGETIGSLRWADADVIEGETEQPEEELTHLFETMVHAGRKSRGGEEEIGRPPAMASVARDELTALMRSEFETRGVWPRLGPTTIESYASHTFRHTYHNGRLHVFEPISLNLRSPEKVVRRGELWRGRLDTLMDRRTTPFAFYALIQLPDDEELRERAEAAVEIIQHASPVVRTFTLDRLTELGTVAEQVIAEEHG
jgi:DUF3037 family protein